MTIHRTGKSGMPEGGVDEPLDGIGTSSSPESSGEGLQEDGDEGWAETPSEPPSSRSAEYQLDDVDIRDLLRKALDPPTLPDEREMLSKVQQEIRQDTRGRFFADGWSTSESPKTTYIVTALVMLAVMILLYLMISPHDIQLP